MNTDARRLLRDLEAGDKVRVKRGPFVGKVGEVIEFLKTKFAGEAEPSVFWLTVRVRAFGGKVVLHFLNATAQDFERIEPATQS